MPPHLVPSPIDPPRTAAVADPAAAGELRAAITTTRSRLLDVLHARARTLGSIATWSGPHRRRYDEDAAELLAAGRALDASLRTLLVALEAEADAAATP